MADTKLGEKNQVKIYTTLKLYISEHGFPPTERELGRLTGIRSRSTIHNHLVRMRYEGLIDYVPGKARTLHVLQ